MRTVHWQLGLAIAAGVPALILVSAGPVAALTGPVSFLAWAVSALVGMLMLVPFSRLARRFSGQTGGIAALSARVYAPRSRFLALLSQWSYWLGWSPALAVNSALIGNYLRNALFPNSSAWLAWALASTILLLIVLANNAGIAPVAWLQVVLGICTVVPLGLLAVVPLLTGQVHPALLRPFVPPAGWTTWPGISALIGALFLAGWCTYGSEVALTYCSEYRGGTAMAVRSLLVIGVISLVTYCLVPLALVGTLGVEAIQADPVTALVPLARQVTGQASGLVLGLLLMALLLGLNTMVIGSSRGLYQMALNGDAWPGLGRLNRRGVPGNALFFDLGANLVLLAASFAMHPSDPADVPVALLAASNVGYFITIILALAASQRLQEQPGAGKAARRRGWSYLGIGMIGFNLVLLAGAGAAWGWQNIGLGAVILSGMLLLVWRTRPQTVANASARGSESVG